MMRRDEMGAALAQRPWDVLRLDSDGFQGLGEDSPIDAAAAIVVNLASDNLLQRVRSTENLGIATLAHSWLIKQLINNAVTVSRPGMASKFVRLPDGSYNPAPGQASGAKSHLLTAASYESAPRPPCACALRNGSVMYCSYAGTRCSVLPRTTQGRSWSKPITRACAR